MIQINKAGYVYIVVTIVIGFSAVNTGNNLVYIITAGLLSYMLVSGVFGNRNLRGISLSITPPQEIFAGVEFPVRLAVHALGKRGATFLLRIFIMGENVSFPMVKGRTVEEKTVMLRFPSRGRYTMPPLELSSPFPINLFTRYRHFSSETQVLVFPKPFGDPLPTSQDSKMPRQGRESSFLPGQDADILSIRDYVTGDPIKTIHWKATAKTGILKTREHTDLHFESRVINIDNLPKNDLERTLSRLTHLVLKAARARSPIVMIMNGQPFYPGMLASHKIQVLTKLALYDES